MKLRKTLSVNAVCTTSPNRLIYRHCISSTTLSTRRLVRTAISLYSFNVTYPWSFFLQPLGCWDQDFESRWAYLFLCCVGCLSCRQRPFPGADPTLTKATECNYFWHGIWKCNDCSLYTADVMNVYYLCKILFCVW